MSLTVTPDLMDKARTGHVTHSEFIECIAGSLPYAWSMVTRLVSELRVSGAEYADNRVVPETDAQWGEIFRMMASDSMRAAIEQYFGVRLAFQNCCRAAVFRPGADDVYERFVSPEAQLLNQSPELINC
jgi:hypothetical protein